MALTEPTDGTRQILEGVSPVKITLAGTVKVGDPVCDNSGWVRCDASAVATTDMVLIAGESGVSTDVIVAYREAKIGNFTSVTAGAVIYLSDTAGDYSETAGTVVAVVGFALDTTSIWVSPRAHLGGQMLAGASKMNFRDDGVYIHSSADGKMTISADGTGADDINLADTVSCADNVTMATTKKVLFRDTGLFINSPSDGKIEIEADGAGADDILLDGGVTIDGAHPFATGTGNVTLNGDIVSTKHHDSLEFLCNAFQYPAPGTDWTPDGEGASLASSKSAKKFWIPLNFLKIGDEIVSYKVVGDMVVSGTSTFDCKLVKVNKADPPTTTDVTGGGITQVTADGNFDSLATLSAVETVATDQQYNLEVAGTTDAADTIQVLGVEVKVNRRV